MMCPKCGGRPFRAQTRYGLRISCCGMWAWGEHPMADAETHEARKKAHAAFDPIWRDKLMSRGRAYKLLAEEMGMTRDQCHMKLMTADQASLVPDIAAKIKDQLK